MAVANRKALLVGLVGLLLATAVALRVLSEADWDATIFVSFGEEAIPTREYAEERLGDVWLRTVQGHDGKFFFVQAHDPWILDPEENAMVLDRPLYRSQRMLYPVLAGLGGVLSTAGVVWGLLVVNLLAMGFGTWAVARLAVEMGGSAWLGLTFTLNLGLISEMTISGAGVLSAGLAFLALLMVLKEQMTPAFTLLALAVLAREAMLIAAAGSAFWLWRNSKRKDALLAFAIPAVVATVWGMYLRLRIGFPAEPGQIQEFGWPFQGFVQSFQTWVDDPFNLVVGVSMLLLMILFTRRTLMSSHLVGWAFLGFVILGVLFTKQVWNSWFDISRAIAPVITVYVLLLFTIGRGTEIRSLLASSRSEL
jgi:hypothetical protein